MQSTYTAILSKKVANIDTFAKLVDFIDTFHQYVDILIIFRHIKEFMSTRSTPACLAHEEL